MYIPTEAYLFALFIFGLICLVAILCRVLFFNVKRQNALLDEKEEKMLKLYTSIETIAEDFEDQVKIAVDEIKEVENRTIKIVAQLKAQDASVREAAAAAAAAAAATVVADTIAVPAVAPAYAEPMRINGSQAKSVDSTRFKAANEVLERAERMVIGSKPKNSETRVRSVNGSEFQRIIDETVTEQFPPEPELSEKQKRTNEILALSAEGKSVTQIARELGITRNEVTLVIELGGKVS